MGISYIFEISTGPITPEERMTEKFLNENILPIQQWWEMKGDVRDALIDDEERKEALAFLKDILPDGYVLDVDNETITCPNNSKYLEEMVNRLQMILSDREAILSEEEPMLWWRWEVDRFQDTLFVGWFCGNEVMTINEFALLSMGRKYGNKECGVNTFYIGGIFEVINIF